MLAFTNKIKIVNAHIPKKVKDYIDFFLEKEISYFQKKYGYKIMLFENNQFLIPEYKIELLNKNKKIVSTIENVNKIKPFEVYKKSELKGSKNKLIKKGNKLKKDNKKKKIRTSPRTLWVRKKK